MYNLFKLEPIFIEKCNPKKKHIIIGSINILMSMLMTEFNNDYLDEFLDKLSNYFDINLQN